MIDQYYPGGEDSDHLPRQVKATKKNLIYTKLFVKEDWFLEMGAGENGSSVAMQRYIKVKMYWCALYINIFLEGLSAQHMGHLICRQWRGLEQGWN